MENNDKITILVIEDDINLGYLLKENLVTKSFEVILESNGQNALKVIEKGGFDLCILDVMLPEIDGFKLAGRLKNKHPNIPFLFVTARSLEHDKLHGFELGADDYIVKPFGFKELFYRINVILRRRGNTGAPNSPLENKILEFSKLSFNVGQRTLTINGQVKKLSQREGGILQKLLQSTGSYVTRSEILLSVWGNDDYFTAKSMDVYITRLRKILKEDPEIEIENLYGTGYRIVSYEKNYK
jgi:DNA-binding response OmpR family regulator